MIIDSFQYNEGQYDMLMIVKYSIYSLLIPSPHTCNSLFSAFYLKYPCNMLKQSDTLERSENMRSIHVFFYSSIRSAELPTRPFGILCRGRARCPPLWYLCASVAPCDGPIDPALGALQPHGQHHRRRRLQLYQHGLRQVLLTHTLGVAPTPGSH